MWACALAVYRYSTLKTCNDSKYSSTVLSSTGLQMAVLVRLCETPNHSVTKHSLSELPGTAK